METGNGEEEADVGARGAEAEGAARAESTECATWSGDGDGAEVGRARGGSTEVKGLILRPCLARA